MLMNGYMVLWLIDLTIKHIVIDFFSLRSERKVLVGRDCSQNY